MQCLTINPADYMALQYAPRGRERPAVDCWGLLRLVYRECLARELPAYDDTDGGLARAIIDGRAAWQWVAEGQAIAGDAVLIKRPGRPFHVGVYLGAGLVMHCDEWVGVTVPRLGTAACRGWSVTFWRLP